MKNDYQYITVEKRNHLIIVSINRPEVMNALHIPACEELDEVFNEFSEEPDLWVAIITGEGDRAFCSGNDLKWMTSAGKEAYHKGLAGLKGGWGGITRNFDCYKPIIAAVNGLALGGGFELTLACDIIVAVEHASFALPEPKVGMMASAGGVNRLPRQLPYHQAMGIILTGKRLSAEEACQYGLVNEIVPEGKLIERAEAWACEIMECAPLSVRAAKETIIKSLERPYEELIGKQYPEFKKMMASADYLEGPKAFSEKRKPNWTGK